jgi:uncharacterized membrane protein HdeD (DUF308 family)
MAQDVDDIRKVAEQLNGPPGSDSVRSPLLRPFLSQIASYWWGELLVGVLWMVIAVVVLKFNHAAVVTVGVPTGIMFLLLVIGILMVILAFWVSGQFFLERAYTLLLFAGIWAAMKGITDIVRAFQIRQLGSS